MSLGKYKVSKNPSVVAMLGFFFIESDTDVVLQYTPPPDIRLSFSICSPKIFPWTTNSINMNTRRLPLNRHGEPYHK